MDKQQPRVESTGVRRTVSTYQPEQKDRQSGQANREPGHKWYSTQMARVRLAELGRVGRGGEPLAAVTVRWLARRHGVGINTGRGWIFTDDDLAILAETPTPGRPKTKSEPKPTVEPEGESALAPV